MTGALRVKNLSGTLDSSKPHYLRLSYARENLFPNRGSCFRHHWYFKFLKSDKSSKLKDFIRCQLFEEQPYLVDPNFLETRSKLFLLINAQQ